MSKSNGFYRLIHVVNDARAFQLGELTKHELWNKARALGAEAEFHDRAGKVLAHYTVEEVKTLGDVERAARWHESFPSLRDQHSIVSAERQRVPNDHQGEFRCTLWFAPQGDYVPVRLIVDEAPTGTIAERPLVGQRCADLTVDGVDVNALRWDSTEKKTDWIWPLARIGVGVQVSFVVPAGNGGAYIAAHLEGRLLERDR